MHTLVQHSILLANSHASFFSPFTYATMDTSTPPTKDSKKMETKEIATLGSKRGRSFENYVEAYSALQDAKTDHPEKLDDLEKEFAEIEQAFEEENGPIVNRYICSYSDTAAVLTKQEKTRFFQKKGEPRLFTEYDLGKHPEIEKLLIDIDFLAAETTRLVRGESLSECLRMLYKVAKNTLVFLDSLDSHYKTYFHKTKSANPANGVQVPEGAEASSISSETENSQATALSSPTTPPKDNGKMETISVIRKNLDKARKYHQRAAKLTAQLDYLRGNIWGFLALAIVMFMVYWVYGPKLGLDTFASTDGKSIPPITALLFLGFVSGGGGAIISVMTRISHLETLS